MHLNWKFRFSSPDWKDGGVGGWQSRTPGSSTTKLKPSHLWEWANMGGGAADVIWRGQCEILCSQLAGCKAKMEVGVGGEKRGGESKAKNKTGKRESEMQVLEVTQEVYVKFGWISSTNKANKILKSTLYFRWYCSMVAAVSSRHTCWQFLIVSQKEC